MSRWSNAQKPDLILIGGDLIDNSVVPPLWRKDDGGTGWIESTFGNLYGSWKSWIHQRHTEEYAIHKIKRRSALLRDNVVTLPGGIQIIGRDDRSNNPGYPCKNWWKTLIRQNLLSFWIINRTTCRIRKCGHRPSVQRTYASWTGMAGQSHYRPSVRSKLWLP